MIILVRMSVLFIDGEYMLNIFKVKILYGYISKCMVLSGYV